MNRRATVFAVLCGAVALFALASSCSGRCPWGKSPPAERLLFFAKQYDSWSDPVEVAGAGRAVNVAGYSAAGELPVPPGGASTATFQFYLWPISAGPVPGNAFTVDGWVATIRPFGADGGPIGKGFRVPVPGATRLVMDECREVSLPVPLAAMPPEAISFIWSFDARSSLDLTASKVVFDTSFGDEYVRVTWR